LLGKPTFFPWKMTAGADLSDVPGLAKQKKTKKTGKRFVYKKKKLSINLFLGGGIMICDKS
jgi:hypothetical protein